MRVFCTLTLFEPFSHVKYSFSKKAQISLYYGVHSFSNGPDSGNDAPPRRSLRKREDKSYAESPDLFIDDSVTMRTDSGKQKSNAMEAFRSKDGGQRAVSANVSTVALGEPSVASIKDDGEGDDKLFSISSNHRNGGSHLDVDNLRKTSCKSGSATTESVNATIAVTMNNGDVEMESENEEDEVSAPVGVMPEPKVHIHGDSGSPTVGRHQYLLPNKILRTLICLFVCKSLWTVWGVMKITKI